MCGIAGIWGNPTGLAAGSTEAASILLAALEHRGPDGAGTWHGDNSDLLLVHTRLSIRDLAQTGAQPMTSPSGRYLLTYNGELYNTGVLQREIAMRASVAWRGSSDTEVLLAAVEVLGLVRALELVEGMFAFALWDRRERQLHLVRDRFGEKPLYFGRAGGALVFSSELRALEALPGFAPSLDRVALGAFLQHGYVPAPLSIYEGLQKLPPGCRAVISEGAQHETRVVPYWRCREAIEESIERGYRGDYRGAVDELERLLGKSFSARTVADVPLGVFLSGGIDSSLVAALARRQSGRRLATFSIGSPDQRYDEAKHAQQVAQYLGTEHTELHVTGEDGLQVALRIGELYDEPFADSSAIPTSLLCQMTRGYVGVALSGDGGDELFAGYNRHFRAPAIWERQRRWPLPARRAVAGLLRSVAKSGFLQSGGAAESSLARILGSSAPAMHMHKLADAMGAPDFEAFYRQLASRFSDPGSLLRDRVQVAPPGLDLSPHLCAGEAVMAQDTMTYLPDDLLVKVDRASMRVGLEVRAPFLDRDVFRFAWSLPMEYRACGRTGKRILRDLLYRHVPRQLVDRPKQGFAVPLGDWLRHELREWAADLLHPDVLAEQGLLQPQVVARLWEGHLQGRDSSADRLWTLLAFQAWYQGRRGKIRRP